MGKITDIIKDLDTYIISEELFPDFYDCYDCDPINRNSKVEQDACERTLDFIKDLILKLEKKSNNTEDIKESIYSLVSGSSYRYEKKGTKNIFLIKDSKFKNH